MKFNVRFSVIVLSLLLITSIFAASVIAQDDEDESEDLTDDTENIEITAEEDVVEGTDVISSDEVVVLEEEEVEEELPEYEEDTAEDEEVEEIEETEKKAIFGLTRVTIGEGFVMKSDESDAEFFRGMWVVKRFIERTANSEEINESDIQTEKFGYVVIGVAEEKEKFKIEMTEFSNESVQFDIKNNAGTIVGSMEIKPKRYDRITLWFGTLILNSGSYAGDWSVTAVSKTKIVKPEIKKVAAWKVFAVKQRREAKIKEKAQERMLEEEGLGEFAKEQKGKDLSKIGAEKRTAMINKAQRIEKRIEAKAAARARAGLQ